LHEIFYAGHIKLFAEILELDKHPAFQLTVVCKRASFTGPKR
jgi:succinate-acetate transporter protein